MHSYRKYHLQMVGQSMQVQMVRKRIYQKPKQPKKGQKRAQDDTKDIRLFHHVAEFGVHNEESHTSWENDISGQKGNLRQKENVLESFQTKS